MKLSRVSKMRDLDRQATEKFGIPQDFLMEDAGGAVFSAILKELGSVDKKFAIFCGSGNNGGDGFVLARKLHSQGADVNVLLLGDRKKIKKSAKKNFKIISKMPIKIQDVESAEQVKDAVLQSDVVVDAIFGTGITRDVGGIYRDSIKLINDHGKKVFSVDISSGINGDTGEVMGIGINADYTVTFGLPKIGNILYPGNEFCGKLYVSHISFPPSLYNSDEIKVEIFRPLKIPPRSKDTHKGSYGKALFIAGSTSYLGAPYFSALSFLKAGGGLSYLAAPESVSSLIANKGSEIVIVPQLETETGSIAFEQKKSLLEFSEKVDFVVLGPGISLNEETQELARELTSEIKKPLLIDGDGITAISEDLKTIQGRKAETILTPHPGEMSRIAEIEIGEIKKKRADILQQMATKLNATIVLKEARSLTGYPDGRVLVNVSGNPGMATAGSGDVLTGTIAAMYGLDFSIEDAVPMGVFLHGLSGDLAKEKKGEDGMTAQDILDFLPDALKFYRENFNRISKDLYGSISEI